MPRVVLAKRGEEYLPGVQLSALEEMHRRERPGKSRDRLQAAVFRKRGMMLKEMGRTVGVESAPSTGGCPGWSARAPRADMITRARAGRGC